MPRKTKRVQPALVRRELMLRVRMSIAERDMLQTLANDSGVSASEFIRLLVRQLHKNASKR